MLNENKECSVDKLLEKIKYKYGYHKTSKPYYKLPNPIKAKVLGYVKFRTGVFILVEQIELLKKDK